MGHWARECRSKP
jgi:hypothetical protein